MPHSSEPLFQPIRIGSLSLSHRVVLAPLTRFRADDAHVPTDIMVDYYAQRASVPGSFLITEGTFIAPKAGGYDNVPGIWNDEQVRAWKKVSDAVHSHASFIFMQLWPLGRAADPSILAQPDNPKNPGGPYPYVSSSDVPLPNYDVSGSNKDNINPSPRPLTHEEIIEYIDLFGKAAFNAVHRAGFDGVEIHASHGYLIDQFFHDTCNQRRDQWGGNNIENRIRFALEIVKKIVTIVGEERTAIRLSPFNTYLIERMKHVQPTFATLVSRIREAYPRFAYLHVVEPRMAGIQEREVLAWESNDFLRAIWKSPDSEQNGSVFLSAGGYNAATAFKDAKEKGDLIVFGRYHISNPDLSVRIRKDIPFTAYDRNAFYASRIPEGYVDYIFADPETRKRYQAQKEERERIRAQA